MPLFLLLILIACLQVHWQPPPPTIGVVEGAISTWVAMSAIVAATACLVWFARRKLEADPGKREFLFSRYSAWRFYNVLGTVVVFGLSLHLLGWGWVIQKKFAAAITTHDDLPALVPGAEILVFAPLLFALVLSWTIFYDLEKALHGSALSRSGSGFWKRWSYVAFHLRHNLGLACAPLLVLIFVKDLPPYLPTWLDDFPVIAGALVFAGALALFLGMPWIVRLVLGLKSLPASPLRARLDACAGRLRFRSSDILVWNTRGAMANAMVVGIIPWIRYVVFTDRLLMDMTPDEVESVFGHEVGHVKHRHMLYYLAFLVGSLAILTQIWERLDLQSLVSLSIRRDFLDVPLFTSIGAYIFLVFGFLSRRCERQADVYGCRAVSCTRTDCLYHDQAALAPGAPGLCPTGIRTFIGALEKVAILNGINRDRPGWLQSWQHSTIARRVEFLQKVIAEPQTEARFQRTVAIWKWSSVVVLGLLLLFVAHNWGWASLLSF
jgi:STE24 endopeptidase